MIKLPHSALEFEGSEGSDQVRFIRQDKSFCWKKELWVQELFSRALQWSVGIDPAGLTDLVQLFFTTYPVSSASSRTCQKCWQQLVKAKKAFSSMKGIVKEISLVLCPHLSVSVLF